MQLPRVVIAAVFFVIGALIAIPALMKGTSSESRASTSATTSSSPSPSGSSPTPTGTRSGGSTHRPTATPTKTTKTPTPSPTRTSSKPASPVQPLTVTLGSVTCPSRTVNVTVHNSGTQTEDYAIEKNDDTAAVPGRISPGSTRTTAVKLREDVRTRVQVTWKNAPIKVETYKANCKKASGAPTPSETPPSKLPHTGPDDGVLWARALTGGAAMITGLIIFWYGGVWPRRREQIFAKKSAD